MDLNNDMVVIGSIVALVLTIVSFVWFGWRAMKTISSKK
ncbi:hypothetical protein MNB_SUP05-5-999 [hydrothermal vent metagenome]|uniref:Uncharacterized protein n=1 Tax=hydrothermal vent metagenome TaxID=652676 RepID=A0A1W1CRG9_9ZZZZ